MLFDYTYLLKNFDAAFFTKADIPESEFIISINEKIGPGNPELFRLLSNSPHRFCFHLPGTLADRDDKYIREEIIQNIVRFLFLPNYMRINENCLFFIDGVILENEHPGGIKNALRSSLKKQGIADIVFEDLSHSAEKSPGEPFIPLMHTGLNHYLTTQNKEDDFDSLATNFLDPKDIGKKWIVPVDSPSQLEHTISLIEKFEAWLIQKDPLKTQLIQLYKNVEKKGSALQSENKILKFKLDNSAYYLQLIRKEAGGFMHEIGKLRKEVSRLASQINNPAMVHPSQAIYPTDSAGFIQELQTQVIAERKRASEIFEWYKNEYEILPMSYKRFGQLIKVFKGKRTFRSLFK